MWQTTLDVAANIFAGLISDEGGNMIGLATLLAIGLIALIRWHRAQRVAKKQGMAAWQFIGFCFVVALLAAACGAYGLGLRASTNPVATIESGQTANPSPTLTPKISKNYFPAEKIELGDLLSGIAAKLNNEGLMAANQGYRYSSGQFASSAALTDLSSQVGKTMDLVEAMRRGIWDEIILKNPRYETELNRIVQPSSGNPIVSFQNPLESYRREIDILARKYDGFDDETQRWLGSDLLGNFANSVHQASDSFKGWIQQCNNRIDNMRDALR
jgi:hypothetical protein